MCFWKQVMIMVGFSLLSGCTIKASQTPLPIPLPTSAKHVSQGTQLGGYRFISFSTYESPDTILNFYRQSLPDVGWKYMVYDGSDGVVYSPSMVTLGKRHLLNVFIDRKPNGLIQVIIREADE